MVDEKIENMIKLLAIFNYTSIDYALICANREDPFSVVNNEKEKYDEILNKTMINSVFIDLYFNGYDQDLYKKYIDFFNTSSFSPEIKNKCKPLLISILNSTLYPILYDATESLAFFDSSLFDRLFNDHFESINNFFTSNDVDSFKKELLAKLKERHCKKTERTLSKMKKSLNRIVYSELMLLLNNIKADQTLSIDDFDNLLLVINDSFSIFSKNSDFISRDRFNELVLMLLNDNSFDINTVLFEEINIAQERHYKEKLLNDIDISLKQMKPFLFEESFVFIQKEYNDLISSNYNIRELIEFYENKIKIIIKVIDKYLSKTHVLDFSVALCINNFIVKKNYDIFHELDKKNSDNEIIKEVYSILEKYEVDKNKYYIYLDLLREVLNNNNLSFSIRRFEIRIKYDYFNNKIAYLFNVFNNSFENTEYLNYFNAFLKAKISELDVEKHIYKSKKEIDEIFCSIVNDIFDEIVKIINNNTNEIKKDNPFIEEFLLSNELIKNNLIESFIKHPGDFKDMVYILYTESSNITNVDVKLCAEFERIIRKNILEKRDLNVLKSSVLSFMSAFRVKNYSSKIITIKEVNLFFSLLFKVIPNIDKETVEEIFSLLTDVSYDSLTQMYEINNISEKEDELFNIPGAIIDEVIVSDYLNLFSSDVKEAPYIRKFINEMYFGNNYNSFYQRNNKRVKIKEYNPKTGIPLRSGFINISGLKYPLRLFIETNKRVYNEAIDLLCKRESEINNKMSNEQLIILQINSIENVIKLLLNSDIKKDNLVNDRLLVERIVLVLYYKLDYLSKKDNKNYVRELHIKLDQLAINYPEYIRNCITLINSFELLTIFGKLKGFKYE